MKKSAILFSSILAATTVLAQLDITGEFGKRMGGAGGGGFLFGAFAIGVTVLVWLWVIKLWRELGRKRR